jgi:hypothetical protein
VAVDSAGNVYVADTCNSVIRKVTPAGVVTSLAGCAGCNENVDGTNIAALFFWPTGVAVDNAGKVYVADSRDNTIREMTLVGTNWLVRTIAGAAGNSGSADGTGSAARFNCPSGVAVDNSGNLYVADLNNYTIRKMTPVGSQWVVTTLAGLPGCSGGADGTGSAARFGGWFYGGAPCVAVDSTGNVFLADTGNGKIRQGVPALSVPAPRLGPPVLAAGTFGFAVTGAPWLPVDIESSGDLFEWESAGTCVLEAGTNYFVSPTPPRGSRFFRGCVH